ncbi:hypothetical protein CAPTEDRAFT_191933 [Capitella teleta]|uniref:Uncharacterized protein n=1 Tax=Capitella teleta TaxID=283909 RepID=R7VDB8_CAPTE|nr:hypothetical protein CAPTEDRAFT_191933 [Capitella teleta]|eukprot:ELU16629.1 hypothetical protein CAPTEDRAFT_191933 [Capitella teleta]
MKQAVDKDLVVVSEVEEEGAEDECCVCKKGQPVKLSRITIDKSDDPSEQEDHCIHKCFGWKQRGINQTTASSASCRATAMVYNSCTYKARSPSTAGISQKHPTNPEPYRIIERVANTGGLIGISLW